MKPTFTSAQEARAALAADRLGTVYYRLHEVLVVTAHGHGVFSRREWEGGVDEGQYRAKVAPEVRPDGLADAPIRENCLIDFIRVRERRLRQ